MNMEQRDYFNKLYHGTNEVINELCSEGSYQEGTYVLYINNWFKIHSELVHFK